VPAGVPATAVPETRDVSHENLIRADRVPVRASCWRVGDPLPGGGLHQFA
jgi:hypothetical protein